MSGFTPGPWTLTEIHPSEMVDGTLVVHADRPVERIAISRRYTDASARQCIQFVGEAYFAAGHPESEMDANARLMAAAPDLLAACRAQHEAIDRLFAALIELGKDFYPSRSGQPWDAMVAGNAAIAKATAEGK